MQGQVVGAENVVLNLRKASDAMRARIGQTVERLGLETLRVVKDLYLSGGALGVRTGRLRRSINEQFTQDGDTFVSTVGTNVEYGRFWELGFNGTESVREHLRRTPKGAEAIVHAHQRRVSVAARPFLQPALDDMGPRIHSALEKAAGGTR